MKTEFDSSTKNTDYFSDKLNKLDYTDMIQSVIIHKQENEKIKEERKGFKL